MPQAATAVEERGCGYTAAVENHQRLSALDASFLGIETQSSHMHVGALLTFEAGPLATDTGGIDFARICSYMEAALDRIPRYRQRIEWIPGLQHPVWVDDTHFNIHYHVRHTCLPRPGGERLLKRLAGRIFSQKLDRSRPLWEMWVVEGLENGRFALIPKIHHCMIDGVAGVDFMAVIFRGMPDETVPEKKPWTPRPTPGRTELLRAEVGHRARGSRKALSSLRQAAGDLDKLWQGARDTASGLASTLSYGLKPASPSILNPKGIGPHRRFDVCHLELQKVKEVKNRLGGKVNDVVLATATGALTRFIERRGGDVTAIDDFRALVPVNIRKESEHGAAGNRVAMLVATLPLSERDPQRRYSRVRETMDYLKTQSKQVESTELLEAISDLTATSLVRELFRVAGRQRAYNVVITNVPGPPFPLYLLGARLEAVYPLVPLFHTQSLGIALFSYAGRLDWGLTGDWQSIPDLYEFAADLRHSFEELCALAS